MNWFQKAVSRVVLGAMRFSSRSVYWRQQNGLSDERDYGRLVGDGSANSIVNACLLWMVRSFPEAPPALWEVDDASVRNRVAKHPMIRLLKYPTATPEKVGGFYSGVLLWMATLTSWVIDGNAYWLKVRSAYGRPVQLWYVPHWMMEPRWPTNGSVYVSHYDYRVDGEVFQIDPSNVVHFRHGLDPDNTRKGKAPLSAVLREVYTDEEAARFTASILKNFGMPGLVVSPDMVLGGSSGNFKPPEMDIQAMKKRFKEEFGGDQRGAPFVSNLPIKLQEFGFSPQQLDLTALRHVPEQRVTATLGLPAAVVGFGAGLQHTKVGATMAEMRDQAWQSSLIPNQRLMASEVQIQLLPDFETDLERYEFGFDTSQVKVLQDDKLKLADVWGALYSQGIAKRNEARAPFELPSGPEDNQYVATPTAVGRISRPGRGAGNPGDAPTDGSTDTSTGTRADGDVRAGVEFKELTGKVDELLRKTATSEKTAPPAVSFHKGAFQHNITVDAKQSPPEIHTHIDPGAIEVNVAPPNLTVEAGAIQAHNTFDPGSVAVTVEQPKAKSVRITRDEQGQISGVQA